MNAVAVILILLALSSFAWYLGLSKSFRAKSQEAKWKLFKTSHDEREMEDATLQAGALVLALTFTIISICVVIVVIFGAAP